MLQCGIANVCDMNLEITDSHDVLLVAVGSCDCIYCEEEEKDFDRRFCKICCNELIHRVVPVLQPYVGRICIPPYDLTYITAVVINAETKAVS